MQKAIVIILIIASIIMGIITIMILASITAPPHNWSPSVAENAGYVFGYTIMPIAYALLTIYLFKKGRRHLIRYKITNHHLLNKYDIQFIESKTGSISTDCKSVLSSYLNIWKIPDIDYFIADINLSLEGNFNLINDPNYGDDFEGLDGEITPNELELYVKDDSSRYRYSVPLSDFKELLINWRKFQRA